jgi:hypothetical protein
MKKSEFLAVHARKLEEFLEKLGLWESLSKGKLRCAKCGALISQHNIGLIIPSKEGILVCCSGADCIHEIERLHHGAKRQ